MLLDCPSGGDISRNDMNASCLMDRWEGGVNSITADTFVKAVNHWRFECLATKSHQCVHNVQYLLAASIAYQRENVCRSRDAFLGLFESDFFGTNLTNKTIHSAIVNSLFWCRADGFSLSNNLMLILMAIWWRCLCFVRVDVFCWKTVSTVNPRDGKNRLNDLKQTSFVVQHALWLSLPMLTVQPFLFAHSQAKCAFVRIAHMKLFGDRSLPQRRHTIKAGGHQATCGTFRVATRVCDDINGIMHV